MIVFMFLITLISGGETIVAKPTLEACQELRDRIADNTENVKSVSPCIQGLITTVKNDVKGGA
jgi:hypothetical protein